MSNVLHLSDAYDKKTIQNEKKKKLRCRAYAPQRKKCEKACKLRAPAYAGARTFSEKMPPTFFI